MASDCLLQLHECVSNGCDGQGRGRGGEGGGLGLFSARANSKVCPVDVKEGSVYFPLVVNVNTHTLCSRVIDKNLKATPAT